MAIRSLAWAQFKSRVAGERESGVLQAHLTPVDLVEQSRDAAEQGAADKGQRFGIAVDNEASLLPGELKLSRDCCATSKRDSHP
jgi:hypothetical protein